MKISNIFSEKNLLILGILLMLLNLGFLYKRFANSQSVPGISNNLNCEVDPSDLKNIFKSGIISAKIQWQDTLHVYDADNKASLFKNLLSEHRKVIFRFSELNCNVCIDTVLNILNTLPQGPVKDHIIILASYKSFRDFLIFKRINKIKYPIYNVPESVMSSSDIDAPFFFVTGQKEKSVLPFIPDRDKPDLTLRYLMFIRDYLL